MPIEIPATPPPPTHIDSPKGTLTFAGWTAKDTIRLLELAEAGAAHTQGEQL